MSRIEDGGPAFPVPHEAITDENGVRGYVSEYCEVFRGMSLRDWFAGMAAAQLMPRLASDGERAIGEMREGAAAIAINNSLLGAAKLSYALADAMLAQRKAKEAQA